MRVIAGTARGRRLRAPGGGTRPLGDRVKQTLFAILEPELAGARVLDLFAGSGAAGIEALSRGAGAVWFVELEPGAIRTIEDNLAATGLAGANAVVARDDVPAWVRRMASQLDAIDVAIVDPPYARPDLLDATLELLGAGGSSSPLRPGAIVVAKHFWRGGPASTIGLLASERVRRFGETALTFYRREATDREGT
jgi:16S rRNA (guanine966-N2)-methyltransferase